MLGSQQIVDAAISLTQETLNWQTKAGRTAAMMCTPSDSAGILQSLHKAGADISLKCDNGTALIMAVENDSQKCMNYLLDQGGDVNE